MEIPIRNDTMHNAQWRPAMKEKTLNAIHFLFATTRDDLGFFIICGIALAVILKLAAV